MMKSRYTTIHHDIREKLALSVLDYCLLDTIDKLSNRPEFPWCEVSRPRLAEFFGVDHSTVKRAIRRFKEMGLLEVEPETGCVRTTLQWHSEVSVKVGGKMTPPGGQNALGVGGKMPPLYIYNDINKDNEVSDETSLTFEEWIGNLSNITTDYEGDGEVSNLVYRRDGRVVSEKTLRREYEKSVKPPEEAPKRPLKGSRTRDSFDFDTWLDSLRISSNKADKIVALIWREKGYRFDNYQQWRAQMDIDGVYARKLLGYSGQQISEAIERCKRDGEKGGYEWKASTVVKKIAEITV